MRANRAHLCQLHLLLSALGRRRDLCVSLPDLGEVALHVIDRLLEYLFGVLQSTQGAVHIGLEQPDKAIAQVHGGWRASVSSRRGSGDG
jgi:hypothetical protein